MHRPLDEPPVPSAPARVPRRAWTGLATVRDLLAVEPLRLSLVAGARGIDRPIRWAHAIELPDPRPYLRGHELVLTMGAWLVDRAACERFVGYLLERDASGIGFGVGNYHPHAPDGLRAACDAADLALVEVPFEVPFVAITEELAERLARQRTERDRRALRREALLLDALGEGRGLAGIAAILARELGGAVAVLGPDGTLEAVEAAGGGAGRGGGRVTGGRVLRTHGDARSPTGLTGDSPVPLATMLARALRGRRPDARRIAHTEDGRAVELSVIRHGGRPIGWLAWVGPDAGRPRDVRDVLAEAAPIAAIELTTRAEARERERRTLGRLLAIVRSGVADPVVLAERIGEAGLDPSRLAAAVWPADTAERLGRRIVHGLVGTVDDEALVVGPDEESLAALARELGVPCGIGRVVPLADLARSLAEAEAAFAIGRERGRVATWRELATLGALVDHQPAERLAPFVEQLIVPLVEHDARRPAELLPTLEAFLAADGAIEPTARRLHIHPNSLRYRLRRIAVLTGRDPRRFLDRAAFQVGLQAWASAHRRNLQQRAGNVVRADD